MDTIKNWMKNEPAMFVAIILGVANMMFGLTVDQQLNLQTAIESLLIVIGGGIVRQQVTPTANIK